MQKKTVITLGLLSLATLGLTTAHANVKLKLDDSSILGMVDDVSYELDNNFIEVYLDDPVLCNQADSYVPSNKTMLKVYDPNLEMKGGFTGNQGIHLANANYQINNGFIQFQTENPEKAHCVSKNTGESDVIFQSAFEVMSGSSNQLEYVGLPDVVSPGQTINYQIRFNDSSNSGSYLFDLLEYWDNHPSMDAYIETVAGSSITQECITPSETWRCEIITADSEAGIIRDIDLHQGTTLEIDVTQVVSPNSVPGNEINFMAALFRKSFSSGNFVPRENSQNPQLADPFVVSKTVTVQANNPPVLGWITNSTPDPLTTIYEDQTNLDEFKIIYRDSLTAPEEIDITVSSSSSDILTASAGAFVPNADNTRGTRTITLHPKPDANTEGRGPVTITVTAKDEAGAQTSLSFEVEITPVNDAPTFAMNCSELTIKEQQPSGMTCTSPIQQSGQGQIEGVWDDEFIIADFNPGPNESHQIALQYEVQVVDNTDGILDQSGSGSPVFINPATGEVSVVTVNGQYGSAEVQIRVKDNGGTSGSGGCGVLPNNPENGCDVSGWQTLNIVSQPYQYSVGGQVIGVSSGDVKLNLTGTENGTSVNVDTEITTNSDPFPFTLKNVSGQPQLLDNGTNYTVSFKTIPFGFTCSLNNPTGTISGANINNIEVACTPNN